jgi:hypothetical protein
VAYDWLATSKPLVITEPLEKSVLRPPSPLLDELPLLAVADIAEIRARLTTLGLGRPETEPDLRLAELSYYYFGATSDRQSSLRFAAAIDEAYAQVPPG